MGKRLNFWPLAGFLTVSALGTLAHFAYEWSGKQLLAGAFCAVNESTWEHMKLLFFPALLFTFSLPQGPGTPHGWRPWPFRQ